MGLFLSNSVKAFTKIYLEKNKNPSDSANKKINDKVDISSNFNNYTFKDISDNEKLKLHNISKKIIYFYFTLKKETYFFLIKSLIC